MRVVVVVVVVVGVRVVVVVVVVVVVAVVGEGEGEGEGRIGQGLSRWCGVVRYWRWCLPWQETGPGMWSDVVPARLRSPTFVWCNVLCGHSSPHSTLALTPRTFRLLRRPQ